MSYRASRELLQKQAPTNFTAGTLTVARFFVDLAGGLNAADIMEIGVLPAGCRLRHADMISTGIDAVATIDIGFLTGVHGNPDDARTMPATAELFNDVVKNQTNSAAWNLMDALGVSEADRGIGLRLSATEAAGAATSVTLVITYFKP